jgi:hypothetical protein
MDGALVFGWAIWTVFLVATIIYWLEIGFDILSGVNIFLSDAFRALACTLVTNWFLLVPEWNKLHLFWIALLIVTVADCVEYRRLPPLVRVMRRIARQPIKHSPSPTIAWSYGRRSIRARPSPGSLRPQ